MEMNWQYLLILVLILLLIMPSINAANDEGATQLSCMDARNWCVKNAVNNVTPNGYREAIKIKNGNGKIGSTGIKWYESVVEQCSNKIQPDKNAGRCTGPLWE